jgi:tetratricopeptide (TPR) repeat protein
MAPKWVRRWIPVVIALVLAYAVLGVLQFGIDRARSGLLGGSGITARERLVELGTTVMLGSLRTVAVAVLWYQAQELKEQKQWAELDGVFRWISRVQPTDIEAQVFQAWNMAFNVQYDATTVVEGWRWIEKAVDFAKQGARRNQNHPLVWKLYWQIADIYSRRCASVQGDRTRYFRDQVLKKYGKSPHLVAAEWYKKAFKSARETQKTNPSLVNVHWVAMWAYAYEELARDREAEGKIEECIRFRQEAIDRLRKVCEAFPDYAADVGDKKVGEWENLIALYRLEKQADQLRQTGSVTEEMRLRLRLAAEWGKLMTQTPSIPEYGRSADRAADALRDLRATVSAPELRTTLLDAILRTRVAAAHPERQSKSAVDKLESALRLFDERLAAIANTEDLLRERSLVLRVARAWGRVLANPGTTEARSRAAAAAIERADRLVFRALPESERPRNVPRAVELWITYLSHSKTDAPIGRQRVRDAAVVSQAALPQEEEPHRVHAVRVP